MADTNAILSSDKSSAPTVALLLLCALISIELAAGVRGLWGSQGTTAASDASSQGTMPAAPVSDGQMAPLVIPPIPGFSTPIPSGAAMPPPIQFTNPMPSAASSLAPPLPAPPPVVPAPANKAPPANSASRPPKARIASTTPPVTPSTVATMLPANPAPPPAAPLSSTGNSQADELLEVAVQSRDLGDPEGALQALNRADLLVPSNPRIMREKALTLQRLGKADEAKDYSLQAAPTKTAPPPAKTPPTDFLPQASPPDSLNRSFGSRPSATTQTPNAVPPPATLHGALTLGECQIERDPTVLRGERFSLKVPLLAAPGEVIDPAQMILDVLFYDKVNGERIELTMADKPKFAYDTAGDFKGGREVLSVLYNLPEFTPTEIAQLGRHVFYGYVVKLYYKNRLMGATAYPPDLSTAGDSAPGK